MLALGRNELSVGSQKAAVIVILVESRPNACTELLGLSQAGNISGRSVFGCTAGPSSQQQLRGWQATSPHPRAGFQRGGQGNDGCRRQRCKGRQLEAAATRSGTSTRLWPIPYKNARGQKLPANHGDDRWPRAMCEPCRLSDGVELHTNPWNRKQPRAA